MATGRPRSLPLSLALLALLAPLGCAGSGPLASRQANVGSLKASVSQLEFENEKLKKEVGELKVDNSRLDNQLAQETQANGEMSARLDDAKDLIRRQGGSTQAVGSTSKNFEDDIPSPVATPKPRRAGTRRPPPAVSIPAPPPGDDLSFQTPDRTARDVRSDVRGDDDRWLPVARGLPAPVKVRQ